MLRVGLTGGIASGKTAVSDLFAQQGAEIIDTDLISRELVEPGTPLLAKITDYFGKEILTDDSSLDRQRLREIVFSDESKRQQLEEMLHPAIRERVNERVNASTANYVIIVIPLLQETRYPYELDRILVVDTPESAQIERLIKRDNISAELAKEILKAQATRQSRLEIADDIISNDENIDALKAKVSSLHRQYIELSV